MVKHENKGKKEKVHPKKSIEKAIQKNPHRTSTKEEQPNKQENIKKSTKPIQSKGKTIAKREPESKADKEETKEENNDPVDIDKSISHMFEELSDDQEKQEEDNDDEESLISDPADLDFGEDDYISDADLQDEKEELQEGIIDKMLDNIDNVITQPQVIKLEKIMKLAITNVAAEESSVIEDPKLWNKVLVQSFKRIPLWICEQLNPKGIAPKGNEKLVIKDGTYKTNEKIIRSFLRNYLEFMEKAVDSSMIEYVLTKCEPIGYFTAQAKTLNKKIIAGLLKLWGNPEQGSLQKNAYAILKKIAIQSDATLYQHIINVI